MRGTSAGPQSALHSVALRSLAASLAKLGHQERASAVVQQLLRIEPKLTLSVWRARLRWLDKTPWGKGYVEALRLAGLPE
jgi:hypothetical protein